MDTSIFLAKNIYVHIKMQRFKSDGCSQASVNQSLHLWSTPKNCHILLLLCSLYRIFWVALASLHHISEWNFKSFQAVLTWLAFIILWVCVIRQPSSVVFLYFLLNLLLVIFNSVLLILNGFSLLFSTKKNHVDIPLFRYLEQAQPVIAKMDI